MLIQQLRRTTVLFLPPIEPIVDWYMKSAANSFGFSDLVTILLPGLVASASLVVISEAYEMITASNLELVISAEWLTAFGIVAVSALVGTIVASIAGLIEEIVLDRITAWRLRLKRDDYLEQWYDYLDGLSRHGRNPYISRVVDAFRFEIRMGVALTPLAAWLWLAVWQSAYPWYWAFLASIIVVAMFVFGNYHHSELAKIRQRAARQNEPIGKIGPPDSRASDAIA